MSRYINVDKMIADTEAMRAASEAISIDGIIKYINEHATADFVINKAIAALEKQIPKKVKNREFETASCPVCGTTVLMLANELEYEKYCPQCGQALDWSEEK